MTIHLTENREQFVRSLIRAGHFASEAEVIDEALRLLEQQASRRDAGRRQVETLLLASLNSGPSTPMTSDDWDEVEREGQRLIADRRAHDGR